MVQALLVLVRVEIQNRGTTDAMKKTEEFRYSQSSYSSLKLRSAARYDVASGTPYS
jgi:hypothetical protein